MSIEFNNFEGETLICGQCILISRYLAIVLMTFLKFYCSSRTEIVHFC